MSSAEKRNLVTQIMEDNLSILKTESETKMNQKESSKKERYFIY